MLTVGDVIRHLEKIAPPWMAEPNDTIGLQIGDRSSSAATICVAVDPSDRVVDKALSRGAQLIVTHHPLIRNPLKALVKGDPIAERAVKIAQANSALYVMHTNYDSVPGGVSDILARKLKLTNIQPLTDTRSDEYCKVVVFVPGEALTGVRDAMAQAGAGRIGEYSYCSFRTQGIGSFIPEAGAQPYIGSAGRLEEVDEWRLEMLCTRSVLPQVLAAMRDNHPYEEPAYDIYPLANEAPKLGLGRVGDLECEMCLGEYADFVQRELQVRFPRLFGDPGRPVKRAAVCGGNGSSLYKEALSASADVYVTGDWRYHDIQNALAMGLSIIDAGHFETEKPAVVALAERLAKDFAGSAEVEYVE
ncbi:MAG: Nif3-like dinuclear metal center hexameric protein [Armatimonadota bacterium]|nr:Nif3-like dinuclear metal center hexameric protein [Armatimonadota bacterium]